MNRQEHLLVKLMEECAEVQQRASKYMQFGPDEIQAGHTETSRERLQFEIKDMLAIVHMLEDAGALTREWADDVLDHVEKKKLKVAKYFELSKSLGCVSE